MNRTRFLSGVVEGFYGRPWTTAQRRALVFRLRGLGLNTYLYAPKDDLRHRARWRDLYEETEATELRGVIAACADAGVAFVYALAPGLDAKFPTADGHAALERKASQLMSLGARHFAVLFDDIIPSPASGQLGATEHDAAPQTAFAHRLRALQRREDPAARLLFCPTPYCGRMAGDIAANRYLRHLGAHLDPAVDVMWTGPEIVSETITPEDVGELTRVLHRRPLIWDNLFANDYDLRRLYLGPYAGRPVSLREATAGVLLNPNCEFEANRLALDTFAAWVAREDYDAASAHDAAREAWRADWRCVGSAGGAAPLPAELFALLCDCLHLPFTHGSRAEAWRRDVAVALQGDPAAVERARAGGAQLTALFEHLTRLENRELLHTVYRHVWELKEEAGLILGHLHWAAGKHAPGATFFSAEHRPHLYRGGLAADLQRLLRMRGDGSFHPTTTE
ncbi:MAG: beta-N-acetylglucosaminidase domain-containing protein [Opitutaceae bacterium]